MPLYLRKNGQVADEEREEAIRREMDRAGKRALLNSGEKAAQKQKALTEMANLREVRKGIKEPPEYPGAGFSKPIYDPTTRCWKSYVEIDGNQDESQWKGWCIDANKWLPSDEYELAHPPNELVDAYDQSKTPVPGLVKRQSTLNTIKRLSSRAFSYGTGRRPNSQRAN